MKGLAPAVAAVLADLPRFSGAEAAGVRLHMGTIISAGEIDAVLLGRRWRVARVVEGSDSYRMWRSAETLR